jgi:hypothetical protein
LIDSATLRALHGRVITELADLYRVVLSGKTWPFHATPAIWNCDSAVNSLLLGVFVNQAWSGSSHATAEI